MRRWRGLPRQRAPAPEGAEPAVDPTERAFVLAARKRGVPWPHVAAQLRLNLVTVRRRHDPDWREPPA